MSEPATFCIDRSAISGLQGLISKLAEAGYSEVSVCDRLALDDLADLKWRHLPIYHAERLTARNFLDLAIELFLLQGTLPTDELGRLFSLGERDLLISAGLLATDENGSACARASLFPVGNRLIFSDHAWPELPHPGYATVPSNHVMAIGRDSRNLARCTTRRRFRTALDLCTGSGVHALLASSHTEQVCAVDINPRAAECTRFNALASGVTNLEIIAADLYESARGRAFDLITANPPFVPSPFESVLFRDGGRSGEDIQKRIVSGLPRHLAPGGMAQIVTELGACGNDDRELIHRLRSWLDGAAIDIHILRVGEHSVTDYAVGHAKGDTYKTFLHSIDEWFANLRAQGYTRIVSLIISFQWSDPTCGPPWARVDVSTPPRRAAGAEIDAVFVAERLTRQANWQQVLKQSRVSRTGPTALLDAGVLGSDIRGHAKATLLGRSLRIERDLDPLERDILDRIDEKGRIAVRDLILFSAQRNVDEAAALAATRSLLRQQLVSY